MAAPSPYHSPLRRAQTAATRERILAACAALMLKGTPLTYALVAEEADVQQRTVYRHFPTKADLEAGLWSWIVDHFTHADLNARTEEELVDAMRTSFAGFDESAPLIQAMLYSPQGLAVRMAQQPRRRAMFKACVTSAAPRAPSRVRERAAAALQVLYSAAAWEQLRTFWMMDAHEAAATIELAIRALLHQTAAETNRQQAAATERRKR
jgi:AcrR family transcriptional regulator